MKHTIFTAHGFVVVKSRISGHYADDTRYHLWVEIEPTSVPNGCFLCDSAGYRREMVFMGAQPVAMRLCPHCAIHIHDNRRQSLEERTPDLCEIFPDVPIFGS